MLKRTFFKPLLRPGIKELSDVAEGVVAPSPPACATAYTVGA